MFYRRLQIRSARLRK